MHAFLRAVGCYWYGFVLVALIWSTAIESVRERIGTTTLAPYLLFWFAALVPGIVILYLAEKNQKA
jgi:hypothetical protein